MRWAAAGLLLGVSLAAPASASASTNALELRTGGVHEIDGAAAGDLTGTSVAAGDVNGDGRTDAVVGAPFADPLGRGAAGSAYVVFGTGTPRLNLAGLGPGGFRIDGSAPGDLAGYSVAAAGDVNGDGIGDVIVGAPGASPAGRAGAGSAYVVFGSRAPGGLDLAALSGGGFRIDGERPGGELGYAVAPAGDVNGDHLADLLVGAPFGSPGAAAFVVFGKPSSASVDLAALGVGGYRIDAAAPGDQTGGAVAAAGDVNRDGRADVLVGAPNANGRGRQSGSAYVVFGKLDPAPVSLGNLGAGGYRIDGAGAYDLAGYAVASTGDVNGDGVPDTLVGAPGAGPGIEGAAYVVYGQSAAPVVDLGRLGAGGFTVTGALAGDGAGTSVAGPGDVDGDGRPDLLIGAWQSDPNEELHAGSAFVVRDPSGPGPVDLADLGPAGFRVNGARDQDYVGVSLAGAGSFDGDPRADALLGASGRDADGRRDAGAVYVIPGGLTVPAGGLGDLRLTSSRFRVGPDSMPRRARAAAGGTMISYRTAAPAIVTLTVFRRVNGRRVNDNRGVALPPASTRLEQRGPAIRCAGPARTRRSRRCFHDVNLFTLTRAHARAGVHRVRFSGRLGAFKLKPSEYVLVAEAKERGRIFGPQIVRFRVVRR